MRVLGVSFWKYYKTDGDRSHSTHSHFGSVKNNTEDGEDAISAGGSSGGSAVAVSTRQCHV